MRIFNEDFDFKNSEIKKSVMSPDAKVNKNAYDTLVKSVCKRFPFKAFFSELKDTERCRLFLDEQFNCVKFLERFNGLENSVIVSAIKKMAFIEQLNGAAKVGSEETDQIYSQKIDMIIRLANYFDYYYMDWRMTVDEAKPAKFSSVINFEVMDKTLSWHVIQTDENVTQKIGWRKYEKKIRDDDKYEKNIVKLMMLLDKVCSTNYSQLLCKSLK